MLMELSQYNPTGRFTGLTELYAKCRPDYPSAALDYIVRRSGLYPGSLLVDVGCGTGISSRLFALRGIPVLGIEPNAEMRAAAETVVVPAGTPVPIYRAGTAEATGLGDVTADAVLAAQAFHWFEPETALREFHRILKPDGWVALIWNERDGADPFTAAYGSVFATVPESALVECGRGRAGEPLLVSALFQRAERVVFAHAQVLDEEGMLGRAFSASYAPREPAQAEAFAAALRGVFQRFAEGGQVSLCYETIVYLGQQRPVE
jgi:SAM-dependent methyltransferase